MRLFVAFLPMCFSWCNAQTHLTINLWQDLANLSWAFAKLFGYNLLWGPRGLNIFISLNIRSGSLLSFIWVCPKVWGPSFRLAKKPWTGEFQWSWYVLNTNFTWCPQERMKFTMNFRSFMFFFSTYYCMVFIIFSKLGIENNYYHTRGLGTVCVFLACPNFCWCFFWIKTKTLKSNRYPLVN